MEKKQKILLQSGTNELEVVEFYLDYEELDGSISSSCYGVNVAKVREIIKTPEKITKLAKSQHAIEGIINFRGEIVPIINILKWLGKTQGAIELSRVIVTEFNKAYSGFLVSSVSRIHRISWENINPPGKIMSGDNDCITGIVKFNDRIMMMLDFEMIFSDVDPANVMEAHIDLVSEKHRGKTILVAEDSGTVRTFLKKSLGDAGFKYEITNNGEEALTKLKEFEKKAEEEKCAVTDFVHLIISDVEMPKMDGLHFLKKIRSDSALKDIPLILFSSMATKSNIKKWEGLGANGYLSKPDIKLLIEKVKAHIL